MKPKTYAERKKAGLCVRAGCSRTPRKNKDGKPRSYCPKHNAQNRKNSDAWVKRQAAKKRSRKPTVIRRKVTPTPVTVDVQKTA